MPDFTVRIARTYYCEVTVSGDNARAVSKRLNEYGLDLVSNDFPKVVDDYQTTRIVSIKPADEKTNSVDSKSSRENFRP